MRIATKTFTVLLLLFFLYDEVRSEGTEIYLMPKTNNWATIPLQRGRCGQAVDNFPASPYSITPFTLPFRTPPTLAPARSVCNTTTGLCISYFEINVFATNLEIFPGFNTTNFFTYNGVSPGPTIKLCTGRQSVVRFINNLPSGISVHLHGSGSLSPWDGWADDLVPGGTYKDYVYPNNRQTTLWYHDHAVHHTAFQAYKGLAAEYWVDDCNVCNNSGIASPVFALPPKEYDKELILLDKVFDSNRQLYFDTAGPHMENLYGDINLVNGVAWPVMNVERRRYRFRALIASVSRPYVLYLSNQATFYVIGSDGGFYQRPRPVTWLLMGVSERYDIIMDFSSYPIGTTLLLLNGEYEDVPMFCQSHLLMKFIVSQQASALPNPPVPAALRPNRPLSALVPEADFTRAKNPNIAPDRTFKFEKSGGQWRINGVIWDDAAKRILASAKRNAVEIWQMETGGGWFHPVHIHLIDFLMAYREDYGLRTYEVEAPKDVIFLGEGEEIRVVTRFGPHDGNWMFHCHNLIHEDNDMMVAFAVNSSRGEVLPAVPITPIDRSLVGPLSRLAQPQASRPAVTDAFLLAVLGNRSYEVFYPINQKAVGFPVNANNPWEIDYTSSCMRV